MTVTPNRPAAAGTPGAAELAQLLSDFTGLDFTTDLGPSSVLATDPHGLFARATSPSFGEWMTQAARVKGCTQPVRLVGSIDTSALPDGVLYKPCGNRREHVCPACAHTYRYDTYHLIAAGLRGGKGVPETVEQHPAVFVTLVAPSFGVVHTGPAHQHGARTRCLPRRDKPRCPHGRSLYCYATHPHTDASLGRPLCLDCYDHAGQVVFNYFAPRLWDRTMTRLRALLRPVAHRYGVKVAIRYAKVAEMQRRGVLHYHAVLRLDGVDPEDPDAIVPPPAAITAEHFRALILKAAAETALRTPDHPDKPGGWVLTWGAPTGEYADVRIIRRGVSDQHITERYVAGYLAKYATKSTEATGHVSRRITAATINLYADPTTHTGRLVDACWTLGRPIAPPTTDLRDPATAPAGPLTANELAKRNPYAGLRRWAHQLGQGGHFSTKSRRYSTTLAALRAARQHHTTQAAPAGPVAVNPAEHTSADEHGQQATTVIAKWSFVGAGWRTTADAALALAAADAARSRRPAYLPE